MYLQPLFNDLANVFDGPEAIESSAREALLAAAPNAEYSGDAIALSRPFLDVMSDANAHPVCKVIAQTPLQWTPPHTSNDAQYVAHSLPKVHVELVGPDGLAKSNAVRLGLYGILPNSEYGIRTHPAEEVFVMLAGQAYWKRGEEQYVIHGPGERSYHPSMMKHGTRTAEKAFLSAYVWHGDISTANYVYTGIP
jgi:hypothetical protein